MAWVADVRLGLFFNLMRGLDYFGKSRLLMNMFYKQNHVKTKTINISFLLVIKKSFVYRGLRGAWP